METCTVCGGAARVIAFIESPAPTENILTHLDAKTAEADSRTGRPAGSCPSPRLGLIRRTLHRRSGRATLESVAEEH